MKKRVLTAILITALAVCGCTKNNTPSQNTVDELPSPTIPPPPTATPTPTPVPVSPVMIKAPEGWTELSRSDSSWVQAEWMDDAVDTLEWMTDMGAIVMTADFEKPAGEKANDLFLMYEDAIKADVYAPHGDCEITMVAYENTVGLLISTKWEENSFGCFVTGSVSSGVGMQALYDALGNFDKFNLYNYDMSKLMNHRISIEGESRSIDMSYKERLEETAAQATGWNGSKKWMESVEGIYYLISSQKSDFEQTSSTISETVYSDNDAIRICDVHLPVGYQRLERYKDGDYGEYECGVYLYGKNNVFTIEGHVPQEYLDYIDDYVWGDDPEPTPEEEEPTEGEEGDVTPTEVPEEEEEPEGLEPIEIFHEFQIPEGTCYIFIVRTAGEEEGVVNVNYMAVAMNNINEIGCSMYVSSSVLDTKKKVIDLVERVFR